jgi:hypothetical protein
MAKQPIDVGVKFTGDASGFQKAAGTVKGSATAMKKDIKATAGIFDELAGAIGGMGGELVSTISSLATAATGIGAMVVVVGALSKAWKTSQENIELYLKSADKLKAGSGGFTIDADKAMEDVRKRARGQITAGFQQQKKYAPKAFGTMSLLYTKEEQKYFALLYAEGVQMEKNGRLMLDSVRGIHDKTEFQKKYSELLKEEEKLHDEELDFQVKWEGLEADFIKQRNIARDSASTTAEKVEAIAEAERIAAQILREKTPFIDRQLANITAIADITQTQEVVEDKIAGLQKEKNTLLKEYGSDMLRVLKMEKAVSKEVKDQEVIKRQSLSKTDVSGLRLSGAGAYVPKGLQGGPVSITAELNEDFREQMVIIGELQGTFASLFSSVGGGFSAMATSLIQSINRIAVQLAAKAAIFAILKVLFPGAFIGLDLYKKGGFGKFLFSSFASGTNFAPGGLALVGERGPELVNLPRGSRVTPNNKMGNMHITIDGRIKGKDLALVLSRYNNEFQSNT